MALQTSSMDFNSQPCDLWANVGAARLHLQPEYRQAERRHVGLVSLAEGESEKTGDTMQHMIVEPDTQTRSCPGPAWERRRTPSPRSCKPFRRHPDATLALLASGSLCPALYGRQSMARQARTKRHERLNFSIFKMVATTKHPRSRSRRQS